MTRRVTLATLRNAAVVAREAGVWVTIEAPDGTLYRIAPEGHNQEAASPLDEWKRKREGLNERSAQGQAPSR